MNRILITGGSSYLGQHLVPLAASRFDVCYTYYQRNPLELPGAEHLDARDAPSVRRLVLEYRPDVIIHTAVSNRSPDMEVVIGQAAAHITDAASSIGARLIHISTDVVFDGRNPPYRESDSPSPLHAYGQAKAEAEAIVSRYANHVIVRTSLIYGLAIMDRSTEWMSSALAQGQPVTLYDNQMRQPVWARTLSLACIELAKSEYCGVLNVAGRQIMSRSEFGLKMLDWWGVKERSTLVVGPADPKWPLDTRLDLMLAMGLLSTPLLGVDEVLAANLGSSPRG